MCGWIERIPGGTRQSDGLETGLGGAYGREISVPTPCAKAKFVLATRGRYPDRGKQGKLDVHAKEARTIAFWIDRQRRQPPSSMDPRRVRALEDLPGWRWPNPAPAEAAGASNQTGASPAPRGGAGSAQGQAAQAKRAPQPDGSSTALVLCGTGAKRALQTEGDSSALVLSDGGRSWEGACRPHRGPRLTHAGLGRHDVR